MDVDTDNADPVTACKTFPLCRYCLAKADAGTRTPDPFITSEVLYQLSYVGGAPGSVYRRPGNRSEAAR